MNDMSERRMTEHHTCASVEDFCSDQEKLLGKEIAYLKKNGGKKIKLTDGALVERQANQFIYSFESDVEINAPNNTMVFLWPKNSSEKIQATVVSCEEFTIVIACEQGLGTSVPEIEMSVEAWYLMQKLTERLHETEPANPSLVNGLVCNGRDQILDGTDITTGQQIACEMSLSQPITFVWGPPGTGKTETLAKIALQHIGEHKKVLMVSYSNVSVDGAIMRVYKLDTNKRPGKLLRYGYPRNKDLINHEDLNSYNLTLKKHPDIKEEREELLKERNSLSRSSSRYVAIGKILNDLKSRLKAEEKQTVEGADFVATTVSKAIVDPVIFGRQFDTVIFDEASMAYVSQIVFAASLATEHFVCLGDFSQLPPIVQNGNSSDLNTDIFHYCGVAEAVERDCGHRWLCMLNTQYRMHPDIAAFSSKNMYRGLLCSNENMEEERHAIVDKQPLPGNAFSIVDSSCMPSVCRKTKDGSRINLLSGIITMVYALIAAKENDVAIITPYHAQSQLLHALIRDLKKANENVERISCATVHQFQGSEKDVVIYDAVDCYTMAKPGLLISSSKNNLANRLFNVALTRAKGKFIAVVNADYMRKKKLPKTLVFRKMIDECSGRCKPVQYKRKQIKIGDNDGFQSYDLRGGALKYLEDLKAATKEICIDLPGKLTEDNELFRFLADLLSKAQQRGVKLAVRARDKKEIRSKIAPFIVEAGFITDPITIIDKKIVWYGMPPAKADFALNERNQDTISRPIFRIEGKRFARSLIGLMEIKKREESRASLEKENQTGKYDRFESFVFGEVKCSQCGQPMKLKKGKNYFLGCTNYPKCDHTELVTVELVEQYLHLYDEYGKRCPVDNTSLEAKIGKYGVYVQCNSGLEKHTYSLSDI